MEASEYIENFFKRFLKVVVGQNILDAVSSFVVKLWMP
jgi:hypothetical protein